jgi:RNA polymerase sigma-70 factor, ECF subfamily
MVKEVNEQSGKPLIKSPGSGAIEEDHAVIKLVLAGTTEAYRDLVDKYQGPVFNLLLRMLHNRDEAEELTQDVFVRAYEYLPRFKFDYRFFSWVYRIAINGALTHMKKKRTYAGIDEVKHLQTEAHVVQGDQREHIDMAISKLKEHYKAVIVLKYFEELSYKDMAVVLDVPEKTVRSRLYDARIRLKSILEMTGYF